MRALRVAVGIISTNPEIITRAAETLTRAATGLALDGVEICLTVEQEIDETADAERDD